MKMEHTQCSETSAYKLQTPGNHPKESIQNPVFFLLVICTHQFLVFHEWISLVSKLILGQNFLVRQHRAVLELIFDSYCLEVNVYR